MQKLCDLCHGGKAIATPDNKAWQKCPLCGGSGEDSALDQYTYVIPFVYGANAYIPANQQNAPLSVQIGMGLDFECYFWNVQASGVFSATVSDGGRQYAFSNAPVHQNCGFGDAQNPALMVLRHIFRKNSSIAISFNELSGANNYGQFAFIGKNRKPAA